MTILCILRYIINNCILFIADKINQTSYVIIRTMDVLFKDIPDACCKYGYTIFEDDSVLNDIQLRTNESLYFPIWPNFKTNDKKVTVIHPWISYEGMKHFLFLMISKFYIYILNCNNIVCEWTLC